MIYGSNKVLCAVLIAAFAGPARALELSPDYHVFKGSPGQKLTRTIRVRNNDAVTQKLSFGFEPRAKGDVPSYISVSAGEFELKSGESREVKVTCRVPKNAAGELYGNLVVRSVPLTGNAYEIRLRPEILLQIEGTRAADVAFAGVSAVRKEEGVRVEARLKNTGNMKLAPKLVAYLDGDLNSERGEILRAARNVFYPDEQDAFTGILALPAGQGEKGAARRRVFVTAFYHAADGTLAKKTQAFQVEAQP